MDLSFPMIIVLDYEKKNLSDIPPYKYVIHLVLVQLLVTFFFSEFAFFIIPNLSFYSTIHSFRQITNIEFSK